MSETQTSTPYHSKALPEGSILREWKLEGVLGVGGFGIVYRGKGIYFDELVAIKEYFPSSISDRHDGTTVSPTDSSSEEVYALGLRKFVEEAKILWNLSKPDRHPNIVSVKSLFEIHGTAYMVMDFERGVSLSQMLREGKKFDEKSLLALVKPISEGLERVHRAGVIHRDIKPANILMTEDARPVLIDFGSARFESGQATSTQVTFYTPPYAAIEQYVKTYPQGPWTDVYALGVALYQCVTGEKPADALERMHGGANETLAAKEHAGFSKEFLRAVDAAMALRPAERPQSMSDWMKMFQPGYWDTDDNENEDATRIAPAPTHIDAPTIIAPMAATAAAVAAIEAAASASEPVAKGKRAKGKAAKAEPEAAPTATPAAAAAAPTAAPAAAVAKAPPAGPAPAQTEGEEAHKRSPLPWLIAAGVAVIAAGAAGAYLFVLPHLGTGAHSAAPTSSASAAAVAAASTQTPVSGQPAASSAAPAGPAAPMPAVQPVMQAAAGLLADAQHAGRPSNEIGAISAANAKLTALAAQMAAPPVSGAAPGAPPAATQFNSVADAMARNEAARINASIQSQAREVDATIGGSSEGAGAVAAVHQAKSAIGSAAAAAGSADPVTAINGARRAIAAYPAFQSAYTAAQRYYAPAKRTQFNGVAASARSVASQIAGVVSSAPRPGLFATAGRKQAFQQMQDNATKAKSYLAQIEQLAASENSETDPNRLSANLAQANNIRESLSGLYASTNALAQANK